MANPMPRCTIYTAVWGDAYVDTFLKFNVRSLLDGGNLPAFSKQVKTQYLIITTKRDRTTLQLSPIFRRLRACVTVRFRVLSKTLGGPIEWKNSAWEIATIEARKSGSYAMQMPPDVVWSRGSLRHLASLIVAGKKAIFLNWHLRAVADLFLPDIAEKFPDLEKSIGISSRELVMLNCRYSHPLNGAYLRDSPAYPYWSEMVFWPVLGSGMLMHVLALSPFVFDTSEIKLNEKRLIEGRVAADDLAFVTDSDDAHMVSLAEQGKDRHFFERGEPLEITRVVWWWLQHDTDVTDQLVRRPFRLRLAAGDETRWQRTEQIARAFIHRLIATREMYRIWHVANDLGLSQARRIIAHGLSLGLAGAIVRDEPLTILLPTDTDPSMRGLNEPALDRLLCGRKSNLIRQFRKQVIPSSALASADLEKISRQEQKTWKVRDLSGVTRNVSMVPGQRFKFEHVEIRDGPISIGQHTVYVIGESPVVDDYSVVDDPDDTKLVQDVTNLPPDSPGAEIKPTGDAGKEDAGKAIPTRGRGNGPATDRGEIANWLRRAVTIIATPSQEANHEVLRADSHVPDDIPGMLIIALPKTDTVLFQTTLREGLGRQKIDFPSSEPLPYANIPDEGINLLKDEKAIYVIQFSPNRWNLTEIGERLDRVVVHLCDPRQALISQCQFIPGNYTHIDSVTGKHLEKPDKDVDWSVSAQVDWQIDHYLQYQIEWIHGWVLAAKELVPRTKFLFTTQEELVDDQTSFINKILDFYGISHERFVYPPSPNSGEMSHRAGQASEWQQKMSWPQIHRATTMIPASLFERFGWPEMDAIRDSIGSPTAGSEARPAEGTTAKVTAKDGRICIHHIGGRGGTGRFPALSAFQSDFHEFLYEADPEATSQIDADTPDRAMRTIWPVCVLDETSTLKFPVLYNPDASSVCAVNSTFLRDYKYLGEGPIDLDVGSWQTVTEHAVKVTSLDDFLKSEPFSTYPDFLSVNTQGSEARILRGAETILNRATIAIMTEVSFIPIYDSQASCDEIDQVLRRNDFDLARVLPHGDRSRSFPDNGDVIRPPIGLRGGGITAQGDLLYFKSPRAILERHRSPVLDLAKACFLGFVYHHFDYAFACATLIGRAGGLKETPARVELRGYVSFVEQYIRCLDIYEDVYVLDWTQLFQVGDRRAEEDVCAAYFKAVDPERFCSAMQRLTAPDHIGIEEVACRFGLKEQAESLKYYRLSSAWETLRYLGLTELTADWVEIRLKLDRLKLNTEARPD